MRFLSARRETPGAIKAALAREVHALDPNLAPTAPFRVQEQVDRKGYTQRLAATLIANLWCNGFVPGGHRPVCGDVLFRFAKHARARTTNGTRR